MAAHETVSLVEPDASVVETIHGFAREGIDLSSGRLEASPDPFWKNLRDLGTELWLDTGDIDGASKLWTAEFTALTTNNTLLNAEVQKGIYDDLIASVAKALSGVDADTLVVEIAFILNARHGLRLAQRFGGKVSVELHTHLAHSVEDTLRYARRFFRLCPEHFIVKIPLTPSGLIATRRLREEGVPINFTLGFSARHNYLATAFSRPSYVNVFLGRLNSYVASNKLGDGELVGEKATLASQKAVEGLSQGNTEATRQIAASIRAGSQVRDLAGVDVMTVPLKAAQETREAAESMSSQRDTDYEVSFDSGVQPAARLEALWDVSEAERSLARSLDEKAPETAAELVDRAHALGAGDLFPRLSAEDLETIATDGKIPRHSRWAERIEARELAADTLLNLAGLASFAADQKALDDRIREFGS